MRRAIGRRRGQSRDRARCPQWSAVVQERHRHEEMTEERTLDSHERQNPLESTRWIMRGEVDAVMTEHRAHDRAPAVCVTLRAANLPPHEGVPLDTVALERGDTERSAVVTL